MWDIKPKGTNEQEKQTNKTLQTGQQWGGCQREGGGRAVNGREGQLYGDERLFDFGQLAQNARIIEMYT